ncbi:serine protease [Candidatus Woesearchaeota archaeon]|nr:MAG: serine protease [Candidatus Woesearchaeota archaeon]
MLKLFFATVVSVFTAFSAHAWEVREMNETVNQTNFIVGMNGRGFCSGTLISLKYRLVLTNHHCVEPAMQRRTKERVADDGTITKVEVVEISEMQVSQKSYAGFKTVGQSVWQAKVVARWKQSDLALLQIIAEDIPHTIATHVFAGDRVYRGETVYAVGNPAMLDATITRGIISNTNRTFRVPWADAEVPFLQMDAGIVGGSSGGALYNDNGELVGVPAAGMRGTSIALAIPFFRVQEFLTNNCYEDVWRESADDHDTCLAKKAKEEEE